MIAVLDYGIGNLRSAEKALLAIGAEVRLATEPGDAEGASGVVLPGVGAFGASMRALRATGLNRVATVAIENGVPFFGICVGYQMLFDGSEENPEESGLGVLEGTVRRLEGDVRLPQMQWNLVRTTDAQSVMLPADEWMYFVHSYVPEPARSSKADVVGLACYGGELAVAIEREHLWGVQFHPEKSGRAGLALLERFVSRATDADRRLTLNGAH